MVTVGYASSLGKQLGLLPVHMFFFYMPDGLSQRSCSISSLISSDMGDSYVTSHPGQLSLAIPSWLGAMNSGNG